MEQESAWQKLCREQAERQKARATRLELERKAKSRAIRQQRKRARESKREKAYADWAMSDFPNQPDN